MVIAATLFIVLAGCCMLAAIVGLLAMSYVYSLSGSVAITRDGLRLGSAAPRWSLTIPSGNTVRSPSPRSQFQLLIFANHSLKSFPSVVEGLHAIADEPALEVIVVMRRESEASRQLLSLILADDFPIVAGYRSLYGQYNVRVTPFAIFVGPDGQVRASSLVNHAWQLVKLWQVAQIPPGENKDSLRSPVSEVGRRSAV